MKTGSDVERLAEAMMTLTVWLAQSHIFGQQDVDKMGEILKPLLPTSAEVKEKCPTP